MLHIIADSMSDITQGLGAEMGVKVVPLHLEIDGETYLDGVTMDAKTFYDKMRQAKNLPKTSQATPAAFLKAYQAALLAEEDEAIVITGSSLLSGTHQSAVIAKNDMPKGAAERIHIIDSLNATLGQALLIHTAVKWRDEGHGAKTIFDKLSKLKNRIKLSATVGDLKYLVMGGRLPAVGAKVGSLLKLKPMVRVAEGLVKTAGVSRGKKVLEWLFEDMQKQSVDSDFPLVLGHSDYPQGMEALKAHLLERIQTKIAPITMDIGTVIGSHAGPGAYGVAWVTKEA